MKWFRLQPSVTLFFIAPIFGELLSGSTPLNEFVNPITLIIMTMLYGSGAILIRERVIRWKKGWPSLLLLGFAYGIYEEGLMVRSFFDPNWVDLGAMATYGRVAGVNWLWAEHLTIYHALISIAASIAFVEALYPQRRADRWVMNKKWGGVLWALLLLSLPVGALLNPYDAPNGWILLTWLAIFALIGLARMLPSPSISPASGEKARPRRYFLIGLLGMFGQYFLIHLGAEQGAYPFPAAMAILVIYDLLILGMILRWNKRGAAWDDRHRLALIIGAMSFFLIIGPLTVGSQYPVMYFSNPIFLALLWLAYRKVNQRVKHESTTIL